MLEDAVEVFGFSLVGRLCFDGFFEVIQGLSHHFMLTEEAIIGKQVVAFMIGIHDVFA